MIDQENDHWNQPTGRGGGGITEQVALNSLGRQAE